MCDPFEDQVNLQNLKFKEPKNAADLVYHKNRFFEEKSPHLLYIPNKLMMLKMMRSFIEIVSVQDLWINLI